MPRGVKVSPSRAKKSARKRSIVICLSLTNELNDWVMREMKRKKIWSKSRFVQRCLEECLEKNK